MRRYWRTCEECGQRAYCHEHDDDGLMTCDECAENSEVEGIAGEHKMNANNKRPEVVRLYKNTTEYERGPGNWVSGKRWIVRHMDDNKLLTTKPASRTRKSMVEYLRGNFGIDVVILGSGFGENLTRESNAG